MSAFPLLKTRSRGCHSLLALFLVLFPSAAIFADDKARSADQAPQPDFAAVRSLIQSRLVEQSIPSLAVAVARDGQLIWEEGFGWADRENRRPATEHTLYSLASISKPITATALMVLKHRGQIDLDRPINDYLGTAKIKAWVGDAKDATVRRVANHTAGLPLHYQFFYADEPYRRPAMDETIRRYGHLVRPPGERFVYSNLGYGVLDYVIARVSGRSYADFLRQEVFLPLGMTRASVDIGPGLEPFAATRYGSDGLPIPFYDFDHPGGSAIFCSAHDLVRFGLFHLKAHLPDQKPILSDDHIEAMQTPTSNQGVAAGYAIGWNVNERSGFRQVSHSGGMGGVSTVLTLVPSEKLAVAVLCNTATDLPAVVQERILATLLPSYRSSWVPPPALRNLLERATAVLPGPGHLTGEWRGTVHTYKAAVPLTLWFKESGDIHVQLGDQLKTLLNRVVFRGNELTGLMMGDLGTEDANRRPYDLRLELAQRGDTLTGAVIAISRPGQRVGNAIGHPVELKKRS
jgi:CubicO group peptidase (beta-lactamase class C family)